MSHDDLIEAFCMIGLFLVIIWIGYLMLSAGIAH